MRAEHGSGALREALQTALDRSLEAAPSARVAGGSINDCVRWTGEGIDLFVKVAAAGRRDMFEAEAAGLHELASAAAIRVPEVLGLGTAGPTAWLALRWIEFGANSPCSESALGEQLASLHRFVGPRFGWHRDNTIGATVQRNDWDDDWARFFMVQRLGVQLDLAERNAAKPRLLDRGRRLATRSGGLFAGYRPAPSLLHGDLWAGNWGTEVSGVPVIFDPSVYYGDREADLAMTRLFGGFGAAFYAAYEAAWPLEYGSTARSTLYNLYHVLNHFNLFGGRYAAQAETMIDRLLAELGG